ncbi:hypothetical protein AVEN_95183-1 [Araneus ventricosus]|uniref:Uncharacterized protein n=1 Tax=Araneus ventricosus TaxID=182803 RepID=A0A4Y2M273_ARAVE|nr:hypothetical protein AVEN_95183-1 [Araneus ventricosus]
MDSTEDPQRICVWPAFNRPSWIKRLHVGEARKFGKSDDDSDVVLIIKPMFKIKNIHPKTVFAYVQNRALIELTINAQTDFVMLLYIRPCSCLKHMLKNDTKIN